MKLLCLLMMANLVFSTLSLASEKTQNPQSQVMIMGMFHFSSPGNDKVKIKHINVMAPPSQQYLQQLCNKIAQEFKPSIILLEYATDSDAIIQESYQQYLQDNFVLPSNEIYQIGFRTAKLAGNVPIASFDDKGIEWQAERLFNTMPTTAPDIQLAFDTMLNNMSTAMNNAHKNKSLKELLIMMNDDEMDRQNKAIYLMTNKVSTNGEFEGALAASSWWHRNFRMFAKIQQYASANQRVLVIGGQGHTAILKDFLKIDDSLIAVDINSFL